MDDISTVVACYEVTQLLHYLLWMWLSLGEEKSWFSFLLHNIHLTLFGQSDVVTSPSPSHVSTHNHSQTFNNSRRKRELAYIFRASSRVPAASVRLFVLMAISHDINNY